MLRSFERCELLRFITELKECGASKRLELGRLIHSRAAERGLDSNAFVSSSLINMYSKCGSMSEARRVFQRIQSRSLQHWTSLMLGYVESGDPEVALSLFQSMVCEACLLPDDRAVVAALKACSAMAEKEEPKLLSGKKLRIKSLEKAMALHALAASCGSSEGIYVKNSLISLYSKCGSTADAWSVFSEARDRDVVSWNSMILGFVENSEAELGLRAFEAMQREENINPNARSFVAALKAVEPAEDGARELKMERIMALHAEARKLSSESNVYLATTLVDLYSKSGSMADAHRVFQQMPLHNLMSWNSLILGYAENGQGKVALDMFSDMQAENFEPNTGSFVGALKASGTDLKTLKALHSEVCRRGFESFPAIENCLIDMYCKCGGISHAKRLFESSSSNNLSIWTALLAGYCRNGDTENVLRVYQAMQDEEMQADGITFICLLNACSHSGLVDKGLHLFEEMEVKFGIVPSLDHYHCVVDLLGRVNRVDEAMRVVERMPFRANAVTWTTLLAGCRKWGNASVGKIAFEALMKLNCSSGASYSLMASSLPTLNS